MKLIPQQWVKGKNCRAKLRKELVDGDKNRLIYTGKEEKEKEEKKKRSDEEVIHTTSRLIAQTVSKQQLLWKKSSPCHCIFLPRYRTLSLLNFTRSLLSPSSSLTIELLDPTYSKDNASASPSLRGRQQDFDGNIFPPEL